MFFSLDRLVTRTTKHQILEVLLLLFQSKGEEAINISCRNLLFSIWFLVISLFNEKILKGYTSSHLDWVARFLTGCAAAE